MKKIVIATCLLFLAATVNTIHSQAKYDNQSVTGSWLGKVPVGAIQLRVIFNLSLAGKDSLVATLDSPDQGAKGIKLGTVTFDGEIIKISAPALMGEYNGKMSSDTTMEGTWTQAGRTVDMKLDKQKTAFALNRPQEPMAPFPYNSEDVTFTNGKAGISLAGTLTIPEGKGPFPAVILITGSGGQNRNEELMGHKPFLVIADYLTRRGIAVLRYDDRGVGRSQGSPLNATSADFATDTEAAYAWLSGRPEIKPDGIGLAGHSEGGLIAPIVASSNKGIAFIVSLAGPGVNGEQIILRQSQDIGRLSGATEEQLKEASEINRKLYAVLKKEKDNQKAADQVIAVYQKSLEESKTSPADIEKELTQLKTSFGPSTYTWFRYFIMTDPASIWKKVKCPVLALNGTKDLQVAAEINLPAIEKALKAGGNKSVTTQALPDLNHLFQHCTTGLPAEYGNIEETFSPEVLKIMADWILLASHPTSSL